MSRNRYKKIIKTGIEALDKMLGEGIPLKSTVLLRGGPGTGKTTLALQILANFLMETEDSSSNGPKPMAVLVSLEKKSEEAMKHVERAFKIKLLRDRLLPINRDEFEKKLISDLKGLPESKTEEKYFEVIGKFISDVIGGRIGMNEPGISDRGLQPALIVIDSLNILANIVFNNASAAVLRGTQMQNVRDAIRIVGNIAQALPHKGVLIFTGEYDPEDPNASSVASESYLCDIDIQLSGESVIREEAILDHRFVGSEVYDIGTFSGSQKGVERRFFCRVLKSRNKPRQTRRCAYDFVDGEGVKFYETYPGDGRIMLFAENAPQQAEWKEFITQDVSQMYLYPSLDYSIFDLHGLQRVITSLRRFLHIPERTSMYLSSFDTYWVSLYVELCQRLELGKELSEKLWCGKPNKQDLKNKEDRKKYQELFSMIVCKAYQRYVEFPKDGGESFQANAAAKKTTDDIRRNPCKACNRATDCKDNDLRQNIQSAFEHISHLEKQCGLLHLIEEEKLRLFGERRSKIIEELDPVKPSTSIPIHRPYQSKKPGKIFAVPYNANVGFIVYRKDLLRLLKRQVKAKDLSQKIKGVFSSIENATKTAFKNKYSFAEEEGKIDAVVEQFVQEFRTNDNYVPKTWEEVIALCESGEKGLNFLIETREFDTSCCTLLEFIWSCGGDFRILPNYKLKEKKGETLVKLFKAFHLLHLMFEKKITPCDSSLEVNDFANRTTSENARSDWLFARHWHSTLIDILTAKRNHNGVTQFVWNPSPKVELGIMPIPVFLSWYIQQNNEPKHVSCWGEWYFGIMKGTENEALAIDLINNLMSSRKVCDRAFSGAALPTVQEFYEMYGDAWCFNLPGRPSKLLPKVTYNHLRNELELFRNAKSRSDIFDYRHTIRELHSLLEYVRLSGEINPVDLKDRINKSIESIESFASKTFLYVD